MSHIPPLTVGVSLQLASEGIEFSGVTMSGDYFSTYSYEVYTIATRAK